MVKATAIIQARMNSSRLPGKVMMELCGKPVLYHVVERLKLCASLESIVLATSVSPEDDVLETIVAELGIACFRGSSDDVLSRFYYAAQERSNHIVRICADSPLLDSRIIDAGVEYYFNTRADIVKTINMPLGLGTEVFSYSALEQAYLHAHKAYQREHVTPYMYENLAVDTMIIEPNSAKYRLTLDTKEDLQVIQMLYTELYKGKHDFYFIDIIRVLDENPEIAKINQHIQQVQVPSIQ